MKDYIKYCASAPKKWELVYWWVLRATMIFAIVDAAFGLGRYGFGLEMETNIQQVLQSFANFAGMFAWEICMIFSKKNGRLTYRRTSRTVLSFSCGLLLSAAHTSTSITALTLTTT